MPRARGAGGEARGDWIPDRVPRPWGLPPQASLPAPLPLGVGLDPCGDHRFFIFFCFLNPLGLQVAYISLCFTMLF